MCPAFPRFFCPESFGKDSEEKFRKAQDDFKAARLAEPSPKPFEIQLPKKCGSSFFVSRPDIKAAAKANSEPEEGIFATFS